VNTLSLIAIADYKIILVKEFGSGFTVIPYTEFLCFCFIEGEFLLSVLHHPSLDLHFAWIRFSKTNDFRNIILILLCSLAEIRYT
jgi:hypothetical protein